MEDYEKELMEIFEKSEKTEIDRKIYEFHLNFMRNLKDELKIIQDRAMKEAASPACYISVRDEEGNSIGGEIKEKAQRIHAAMFNAKEMIGKTTGEEKKRWIQERRHWNRRLIEYCSQYPKYRFIPAIKDE